MNKIDLTGNAYGEWVVLRSSRVDEQYVHYWLCRCSCGIEKEVRHGNLTSGTSKSCGHDMKSFENICIGNVFGEWEVVGLSKIFNKCRKFLCVCSCGKKKYIEYKTLLNGTSKSCGHNNDDGIESGDIFGRWKVIEFSCKNKRGNSKYFCKCSCGTEREVLGSELKGGGSTSCGCLAREKTSKRTSKNLSVKNLSKYDWYFFDNENKKIKCKSSYEVFFWNEFYFNRNLEIFYEPRTFKIQDGCRYTPDFYLKNFNIWIETKGSFDVSENSKKQKNKIFEFSKKEDIFVLRWQDIRIVCGLKNKSIQTYFNIAKKNNIRIEDYLALRMYE